MKWLLKVEEQERPREKLFGELCSDIRPPA